MHYTTFLVFYVFNQSITFSATYLCRTFFLCAFVLIFVVHPVYKGLGLFFIALRWLNWLIDYSLKKRITLILPVVRGVFAFFSVPPVPLLYVLVVCFAPFQFLFRVLGRCLFGWSCLYLLDNEVCLIFALLTVLVLLLALVFVVVLVVIFGVTELFIIFKHIIIPDYEIVF